MKVGALMFSVVIACISHAGALSLGGSVISENQKVITSRYVGYIQAVHVSEGSVVKKGDMLYEIDPKEIETALLQSDLAITQAEQTHALHNAHYQNAHLNKERYKRLYEQDMVSKVELEGMELAATTAQSQANVAKAQVKVLQEKRKELLSQWQYLKVKAPNDGVVIQKHIHVGEMAMMGAPALVLADMNALRVAVDVAESLLGKINVMDDVWIEVPSIGCKSKGKISAIVPNLDAQTHTFKVKASFSCDASVYPGMYAHMSVGE